MAKLFILTLVLATGEQLRFEPPLSQADCDAAAIEMYRALGISGHGRSTDVWCVPLETMK